MRLRNSHLFLLLGIALIAIAFVARSGLFTRKNPGEPANKYMREALALPKPQKLSPEEAAIIDAKYNTAVVKPSGLRYLVRTLGMGGAKPKIGQEVTVNYIGRLLRDDTKFDSSYDRGKPFTFQVGLGQVIPGWDATLLDMNKGNSARSSFRGGSPTVSAAPRRRFPPRPPSYSRSSCSIFTSAAAGQACLPCAVRPEKSVPDCRRRELQEIRGYLRRSVVRLPPFPA